MTVATLGYRKQALGANKRLTTKLLNSIDKPAFQRYCGNTFFATDPTISPLYINAGGDHYAGLYANWLKDSGTTQGTTNSTGSAISGTLDDTLYQTIRKATTLNYILDLPNGSYNVKIHLCEFEVSTVGARKLYVFINDIHLSGYIDDVFASVGQNAALIEPTYKAQVNDGKLRIDFGNNALSAMVSGIEIVPTVPQQIEVTKIGTPVAFITVPTGGGNKNLTCIQDNDWQYPGSTLQSSSYDTYNGGGARANDWIGYTYATGYYFTRLVYDEGAQFSDGGWFTSVTVQVRVSGVWTNVSNFTSYPTYPNAKSVNFLPYFFEFTPMYGDGIRVYGVPGGSSAFIACAEMTVYVLAAIPATANILTPIDKLSVVTTQGTAAAVPTLKEPIDKLSSTSTQARAATANLLEPLDKLSSTSTHYRAATANLLEPIDKLSSSSSRASLPTLKEPIDKLSSTSTQNRPATANLLEPIDKLSSSSSRVALPTLKEPIDLLSSTSTQARAATANLLEPIDKLSSVGTTGGGIAAIPTLKEPIDKLSSTSTQAKAATANLLEPIDKLSSTSTQARPATATLLEPIDKLSSSSSRVSLPTLKETADLLSSTSTQSRADTANLLEPVDKLSSVSTQARAATANLLEPIDKLSSVSTTGAISAIATLLEPIDKLSSVSTQYRAAVANILEPVDKLSASVSVTAPAVVTLKEPADKLSASVWSGVAPTLDVFDYGTFPGGGILTLTGTGFVGVVSVSFQGVQCLFFNTLSPTQIQVQLPYGGLITGSFTVITPSGSVTGGTATRLMDVSAPPSGDGGTRSHARGRPRPVAQASFKLPKIKLYDLSGLELRAAALDAQTATLPFAEDESLSDMTQIMDMLDLLDLLDL